MKPRVVPGIHSVLESFKMRPKGVKQLYIREGELKGDLEEIARFARQHNIPLKRVSLQSLDREHPASQGVIAHVVGRPEWDEESLQHNQTALLYALDSLEDPHNLGSILRTSWTIGVDGIIIPKDRSVGLTPAVEKVASGAVDHVPVLEVTNLVQQLKDLKEQGFWIYGLSEKAQRPAHQMEFAPKSVLVVGSEATGLRTGVLDACDELVKIPQTHGAHNLNAGIAAALVGYEALRQRDFSKKPKNSMKKPLT